MNKFPRIFSLSTIGIKQHRNCDYLVHPQRTDFTGESGSGKSMISDMLQLVLVGSKAFKSSTTGNDIRDAKGMVNQTRASSSNVAYVFLNIEIEYRQFILIGCYIESSHNKVQPFIIQSGYDWETALTPLSKPMQYRDLIVENRIWTIDHLEQKLTNVNLKSFSWKKYHKILFENNILSLDLTNDNTLDNYAAILRSFSRGKGFKTQSESLKSFLFGSDDQHKLWKKYTDDVRSIQDDFEDHRRFIDESKLIESKQNLIKNLVKLNQAHKEKKEQYFNAKCSFWYHKNKKIQEDLVLVAAKRSLVELRQSVLNLQESKTRFEGFSNLKKKLEQLENFKKKPLINEKSLNDLADKFAEAKRMLDARNAVVKWLKIYDVDLQKLKEKHEIECENVAKKKLLSEFEKHLENCEQTKFFKDYDWSLGCELQLKAINHEIDFLQKKENELKALSVFTNIEDISSLASWAIENLAMPISIEIESALIYFQKFPNLEPCQSAENRYLPFPGQLFDNFPDCKKSKGGFWLNLNGVFEFIQYTSQPIFNQIEKDLLTDSLASYGTIIKKELESVLAQLQGLLSLTDCIGTFTNNEVAIGAYLEREKLLQFEKTTLSDISKQELEFHLAAYRDGVEVESIYKKSEDAFTTASASLKSQDRSISECEAQIGELAKILGISEDSINAEFIDRCIADEATKISIGEDALVDHDPQTIISKFPKERNIDSLTEVLKEQIAVEKEFGEIKTEHNILTNTSIKAQKKLDISLSEYRVNLEKEFEAEKAQVVIQDPDDTEHNECLFRQFNRTQIAFEQRYDDVKQHAENSNQIIGYSIPILAHKLLPTVFESSNFDESLIDERIAEKLGKLASDIHEIGSRKVEILMRVVTEVRDVYNQYLTKIRGIDVYLRKHVITGGNKASLQYKKSIDFPDTWMNAFRKRLNNTMPNFGLFEGLEQEVDINKMMVETFRENGGKSNVNPEELLDPKSYFDLNFKLELADGKANAGSNGQTYTANALLGLARLSLINNTKFKGIKVMPIDEAEGLGSNYDLLSGLASIEDYQIISMSIETAGTLSEGKQHVFILSGGNLEADGYFIPPAGIFSNDELVDDIEAYTQEVISNL